MNRSRAVYIAAINGPTLDGGLEIVLACDLRYAADAAPLRMGQMEMLVGVIPGGGGSQRLLRMLGTARALEHVLEGVPLTAAEALELGLVHRVVPEQQLLAEAQATAARLARRSPIAVAALKRCLYFGTDRRFSRALDLEVAGFLATGFYARRGPCPPAFPRRHGASRRHAVPRRSEAVDRGDEVSIWSDEPERRSRT